jgi:hypothetical protein
MTITYTINVPALTNGAQALPREVIAALDRAALETQREMQRLAPKAFSTLWTSIGITREGDYERAVRPGVQYAAAVELGTGPAAGQARYFPDPQKLMAWLKFRAGGAPGASLRDRAFGLARHIERFGTRAQPFVAPTAEAMAPRVQSIVLAAIARAFGGGARET